MEERAERQRTYAMFAIVTLACAFGSMAQTVVNAMLGGIQASFGVGTDVSQWLTTVFMLTIGVTVPLVTHLSRRLSVRSLTMISLAFSFVGALAAAHAQSFAVLVLGRVLQAIGCGITLPVLQTIAMTRFPPGKNATAMGIAGIAMGFAPNIGPLIGGVLVDTWGWRSFFSMLMAASVVLFGCVLAFVPRRDHERQEAHLDFLSFMLSTVGFGALLLSFSNAADRGFADPGVLVPLGLGVMALGWFFVRQGRIRFPLISLRIFDSRTYVASFVIQDLLFASFMGITLVLPLFVINVSGLGPVDAGLAYLPTTLLAVVFNPLAGVLADRVGSRVVIVAASAVLAVGSVSMVFMDATTPFWLIAFMQAVRGIGVSSLIGPLNSWGLSRLEPRSMIDGSAFFTTVRQVCASLGTALMMMPIALVGGVLGYHLAFGLSALFAVGVLVVGLLAVGRTRS